MLNTKDHITTTCLPKDQTLIILTLMILVSTFVQNHVRVCVKKAYKNSP